MSGKERVVYRYDTEEEEAKTSALEDFLFGGGGTARLLAKPVSDGRQLDIAELVKQAEAARNAEDEEGTEEGDALFFEDRAGDARDGSGQPGGSEGSGEPSDEEDEDEEGREGGGGVEAGPGPGSMRLREQEAAGGGRASKKRRVPAWADPADRDITVAVAAAPRLRKLRQAKEQTTLTGEEYEAALRRQHCALNPRTGWAAPAGKQRRGAGGGGEVDEAEEPDEDMAERLLRSGGGLLLGGGAGAGGPLAPGMLELSRLRDANGSSASDAVVQALQFHPNGQLMLTGGFDKRLKLFQVDGLRNPLVQSLFLEDCPIHTAAFAAGGDVLVAAGRRPFYYVADLHTGQLERVVSPPCVNLRAPPAAQRQAKGGGGGGGGSKPGRGGGPAGGMKSCESFAASPDASRPLLAFLGDGGHIGLVSLASRGPVGSLKMNGSARAAAFSADGGTLVTAGGDGVIYTWDLRSQRCLQQQRDEGAVDCASLALSADGSYLAAGGSSGVVNVYRRPAGLLAPLGAAAQGPAGGGARGGFGSAPEAPPPLKALMNLTTAVDSLAFSHDSQLLMMGSRLKREALRLVHLPSLTVFSNWPTSKSPLHYVHCAAFSPHSGFLGIGNAKGRALLYRLHHYPSA